MSYHDITCYVQCQLQNVGQHVFTCCKHRIDSQVLIGKHVKTCGNMLNRDDTGYISPGNLPLPPLPTTNLVVVKYFVAIRVQDLGCRGKICLWCR